MEMLMQEKMASLHLLDESSAAGSKNHVVSSAATKDSLKQSTSYDISNVNWSALRRPRTSAAGAKNHVVSSAATKDSHKQSTSYDISNVNWSALRRPRTENSRRRVTEENLEGNTTGISSAPTKPKFGAMVQVPPADHIMDRKANKIPQQKMRCNSLHQLVFKEGGLPDLAPLTYKLKNQPALKEGYKKGTCIVCYCCNQEFSPSQFEDHAGNGQRRQPYHNIYTSEGITLHDLALQLQAGLNSNGISGGDLSDSDEVPDFVSSSSGEESPISDGPTIDPLNRTLQERLVETESCYLCGVSSATVGVICEDMIIFCNQCTRPCHIKCYNSGQEKKKQAPRVLQEYINFHFLCCHKCQSLRASLNQLLQKRENVTTPIHHNICWQLLSGRNLTTKLQLKMLRQVTQIFEDAFPETAACDSDIIQDMLNAKDVDGEKDFRGMHCAVLTIGSKRVVSAAILQVRTEEFAEVVLVATCKKYRKKQSNIRLCMKGYFTLLLRQTEAHLKALKVRFLVAAVDPEMGPIWSEKFGFTILSDSEKKSLLEAHPFVMFEGLTLAQKSLAEQSDLDVSESEGSFGGRSA